MRRRLGRLIKITGGTLGALALVFALWCWCLPVPDELTQQPRGTLTLLDIHDRVFAEIGNSEARVQHPVPLAEMGQWLPRVTVALEDHRFYDHDGIDPHALIGALSKDLKAGRIVAGGSTITEQLVKMATHRKGRNWFDKLREAVIAWKLERRWSKEQILEAYLNRSHYSNLRLGPEAAAESYFGKQAKDLTLAEAIYLAGLPQAPTRFNPWLAPEEAKRRYERALARLAELDVIDSSQQKLLADNPPEAMRTTLPRLAPNFCQALLAEHPDLAGRIRTTLDLHMQQTAENLVRAHLQSLAGGEVTNAAMIVLDNSDGAVRVMVGSGDYKTCQVNGALTPRSSGSTLKPFIYLAAIDRRILTAATILPDTPDAIREEYTDYDPQNYDKRYLGPVRVREALACSLNVPAVVTLGRLGAREGFSDLQKWGFQCPRGIDTYGAGFILGNAEIRLLDLAGAYAGLERGGTAARPVFLPSDHPPVKRVASREATAIIQDILCDNNARERAFGLQSPLALGTRVAAKTGTSSGFRDGWTVGFDKNHTVAVWAGNMDGRPMREMLSIRSAAPLWAAMMKVLLEKDHPLDPVQPGAGGVENLVRVNVGKLTGLLPSASDHETVPELFLKGTEPKSSSADWLAIAVGDGSKTQIVLPPEFAEWCRSRWNYLDATVAAGNRLAITNPKPNATFEISDSLPAAQQMIEFSASLDRKVDWFINGQKIAPQPDGRVMWCIQPGEWNVSAVSGDQRTDSTFTVENP